MSGGVSVTPNEVNRSLLKTLFKFKTNSTLKQFITSNTNIKKNIYSLEEVLIILKDAIRGERLFDPKNPSVIICSKPLEQALKMKALHVTEIRDLVLKQLERVPPNSLENQINNYQTIRCNSSTSSTQPSSIITNNSINITEPTVNEAPRVVRTAGIASSIYTDKNSRFRLKPDFLKVVRMVPDLSSEDKIKTIFSYEEVTLLLSKYILSRKHQMFDHRNIKLAIVANDPLGVAFGVKAFHRCQVNSLLRSQLIPLPEDSCRPDNVIVDSTSSPGVGIVASEALVPTCASNQGPSLPPFPALIKAASTPESLLQTFGRGGQIRKRSFSGEQDAKSKMSRADSQFRVVVRGVDSNSDTDTETIHSAQSYETLKVEDCETDSADENESKMQTSRVYDVEYDIDSGEEEERPPQAYGVGKEFSSADDSDTDADEKITVAAANLSVENLYWADSEFDDIDIDIVTERNLKNNLWKCVSCNVPIKDFMRYCSNCWTIRKGWAPERPKHKKKSRAEIPKKIIPTLTVIDTDTETDSIINDIEGKYEDRPRFDSKSSISSQDSGIGSQELEIFSSQEITQNFDSNTIRPDWNLDAKFSRSISLDQASIQSSSGVSSMDTESCSVSSGDLGSMADLKVKDENTSASQPFSNLCELCCLRPKNASLIHGRLGHQVCCYPCAKKLWKKQARCPVCRRKVEKIVKNIQA